MSNVQVPRKITFLNALVKGRASEPVWIQKRAELSGEIEFKYFLDFHKNELVLVIFFKICYYILLE